MARLLWPVRSMATRSGTLARPAEVPVRQGRGHTRSLAPTSRAHRHGWRQLAGRDAGVCAWTVSGARSRGHEPIRPMRKVAWCITVPTGTAKMEIQEKPPRHIAPRAEASANGRARPTPSSIRAPQRLSMSGRLRAAPVPQSLLQASDAAERATWRVGGCENALDRRRAATKALFMTVWRPSTRSAENSCGIRQG